MYYSLNANRVTGAAQDPGEDVVLALRCLHPKQMENTEDSEEQEVCPSFCRTNEGAASDAERGFCPS